MSRVRERGFGMGRSNLERCRPRSQSPAPPVNKSSFFSSCLYTNSFGKFALLVCCLAFLLTFISNIKLKQIDSNLSSIKTELNTMHRNLILFRSRKEEINSKLGEIASNLPMLKNMASDLQDGLKNRLESCSMKDSSGNLRTLVKDELEQYNADKTGRTDYALESSGGIILRTEPADQMDNDGCSLSLFGIPLCSTASGARALIQAGVLPGECWAFQGSKAVAYIQLIHKIFVTGFSLEHISRHISPTGHITTAPKEFAIYGLSDSEGKHKFLFGVYQYNKEGRSIQYFPVIYQPIHNYDIIEFRVLSNHGHPKFTCIYRLRVHGEVNKKK